MRTHHENMNLNWLNDMEDFVTYEIAVKLKEKGFNDECNAYYEPLKHCLNLSRVLQTNSLTENYNCITAPTISQVLKWLREVKGIDVLPQRGHINLDNNGKVTRYYNVNIYFERRFACTLDNDEQDYSPYEQAALAGIEYVIDNLI